MRPKMVMTFAFYGVSAALVLTLAIRAGQTLVPQTSNSQLIQDLVYGNRILYNEGVIDAFGHISVRDPQDPNRFYMSRGLAPSQVTSKDILHYDLQCNEIGRSGASGYGERFIHCGVYRARPDVKAVVHGHSPSLIVFGATKTPLRPIFHNGGFLGHETPVFDIREFAGHTDMMVTNNQLGDTLAKVLGKNAVALMRGHGQTVV